MDDGALLLRLAREAIDTSFRGDDVALPPASWLQVPGAVFVTLRRRPDGALRGCVGTIEPHEPLGRAVVTAARAAASSDGRFRPLSREELAWIRLEVSVLSPLTPLPITNESDACRQLEETKPGVVLRCGRRQGVLLPKVWASIASAAEFLQHLKLKAGLPPAFWSATIALDVFTCEDCAEPDDETTWMETS